MFGVGCDVVGVFVVYVVCHDVGGIDASCDHDGDVPAVVVGVGVFCF